VFTASKGAFGSATGAATQTVRGLSSDNVDFLVPTPWDGTGLTVRLDVRPRGTATVAFTQTWTFAKKTTAPTTITQKDAESELELGHVYEYHVGPAIAGKTAPFYEHQTVLERFGAPDCNISPADLKPDFKTAHPELTDSKKIAVHFFGGSGSNGTFGLDHDDKMFDVHSGILSTKADVEPHLVTWKEIHNDLPQIYEAMPGVTLGKYTIRRIIKLDGSLKLRKMKA
jgi:hypothetical protein